MKCQVHESRLISINEDEGKSTRACVFEVDQLNRDQPWSIALKTKHSARNRHMQGTLGLIKENLGTRSSLIRPAV
jgi:hypothetical protein